MLNEQNLFELDITELHEAYKKRSISPVEVTNLLFEKIDQYTHLNTFITLCKNEALQQAKQAEKIYQDENSYHVLLGIPIGVKDLILTKGIRTTMGSGVYKEYIPCDDAVVIKNLKKVGSIILGKQNLHELAYGTTGDDSYFGPTRNPHNPLKLAGGSSSGSAASTAAKLCWGSVGTDTSGSVRIPASICGVVGMKPTFGKIEVKGIHPLSWSMDHVGPITRTVIDNAILFDGLYGNLDTPDSIYRNVINNSLSALSRIKIGIPTTYFYEDIDPQVENNILNTISSLKNLGATVIEINIDIPDINEIMDNSCAIDQAEAYLINRDIVHDYTNSLGEETRRRIFKGADFRAYELLIAEKLRKKISNQFKEVFQKVDALLTPTIPIIAPDIGTDTVTTKGSTYNVRQTLMRFTFISNYIGIPSISLPCGLSSDGLPIGLQLIGDWNQEVLLYRLAYFIENALK